MKKNLLLVDYENVPRVDLAFLDDTYRAIVFVGAGQNPPRAATNEDTAHRFRRVEFQKIAGTGKNALDFHIAFRLGRIFETSRETVCIVVSRDKGTFRQLEPARVAWSGANLIFASGRGSSAGN